MYKLTNNKNEVVGIGSFANIKIAVLSELTNRLLNEVAPLNENGIDSLTDIKKLTDQLYNVENIHEINELKEYFKLFNWSFQYLTQEVENAIDYFDLVEFNDYNAESLYESVIDVIKYLESGGFKFEDIKSHFQTYDLIVIEDIPTAMHYVNITNNLKEFMEDEDAEEFEIVAQNDTYTLLIG